jgi:hypothetical protein
VILSIVTVVLAIDFLQQLEMEHFVVLVLIATAAADSSEAGSGQHLQCWQPDPPLAGSWAQQSGPGSLPPHPRLRVNDRQLAALNRTIGADPTAKAYFEGLVAYGETWITTPLVDCTAAHMSNTQSRTTLVMQYALGLLWRLTGDERFAGRATKELLHVTTNCTTWDPYGLVLAEMTHAVGLGYDWLYHYLTPGQRATIVGGVTRMGFDEALSQYAKGVFWANCTFNWGVVTNGGLTIGGLAFLDEPLAAANVSAVLAKAAAGLRCPFGSFAPHGGWHEGSMYWQYVAEYAVATTEALRGVYGDDRGLSDAPGFNETALFRLHMNGPSQNSFDFGDSNGALSNSAAGYFMGYSALPSSNRQLRALCAYEGRRLAKLIAGYVDPADAAAAGGEAEPPTKYNCGSRLAVGGGVGPNSTSAVDCARLLIDYSADGTDADIQALPTARLFKLSAFGWEGRRAIGFFRSGWSTEAEGAAGKHAYLAFKAANGVPNHNDLDGGTFVFETGGQRWAMDMGADNYQLKNYFTQSLKYRYGYYRKSTAGHNTLTFNNDGADWAHCAQEPGMSGRTEVTLFKGSDAAANPDRTATATAAAASSSPAYSIVGLTAAYSRQNSSRVERGFAFTTSYEHLLIADEFEFAPGAAIDNVTWSMHTMAAISIAAGGAGGGGRGRSATLSLGGATLHLAVIEPAAAVFSAVEVKLQPPYNPSVGVSKLMVVLPITPTASPTNKHTNAPPRPAPAVNRIVVSLSTSSAAAPVAVGMLAEWAESGPFAGELVPPV